MGGLLFIRIWYGEASPPTYFPTQAQIAHTPFLPQLICFLLNLATELTLNRTVVATYKDRSDHHASGTEDTPSS